jgi:hypothetical protein
LDMQILKQLLTVSFWALDLKQTNLGKTWTRDITIIFEGIPKTQ